MAELVEALPSVLALGHKRNSHTPAFLTPVLRNIVVSLARLPLVNSYTRIPPLVSLGLALVGVLVTQLGQLGCRFGWRAAGVQQRWPSCMRHRALAM